MSVRVLVVDDSAFFRKRLTEIFSADKHIDVVGTAENGKEAIEKIATLAPDVITMDIEMPVMDGITAVKEIMKLRPTPILMFSSLTVEGAKPTLDALEAGAVDFLPKRMEDLEEDKEAAIRKLCARVRLVGARGLTKKQVISTQKITPVAPTAPKPEMPVNARKGGYKLVIIGASTGGPVALQHVLTSLPASFPVPILLVQHMPGTFTPAFSERLNKLTAIHIKEAEDGDVLKPGCAYLAPGGLQMLVEDKAGASILRVIESEKKQTYKPSVDVTFGSASKLFGSDVLAIVLTGMGADGREGARMLKNRGANVWAQDEATSVIYGMPGAVAEAGLADMILALEDIGRYLVEAV